MHNFNTNLHVQALADRFAGEPCTLDGEPAKIVGRQCKFATVATLRPSGPTAQFSWQTVQRRMVVGGRRFST
jgi:hypothetical protein|tara:strand:+ start:645 stop:860 length:216 start_codon:yes stop_codon:yes gene_type:complete